MIRIIILLLLPNLLFAQSPPGFLWYNLPKESPKKPQGVPFNSLSYTKRDAVLRFYTMEALHKARTTKSQEDMHTFLSLQNYWLNEASHFQALFGKTMLASPELDYTVTHPTSSLGAKITDEVRLTQKEKIIRNISANNGFLFFYRGKSPYDQKQIPIIKSFSQKFNFNILPVSVDGVLSPELANSRIDKGQADRLGVRYFPAILLVNPASHNTTPIAYGFITQDALIERLVAVVTDFKGVR